MLKLNGLSAGYSGQEVVFLGSAGQGILHAYKTYQSELAILFCNARVEKSWYHASNKIALKAWHRARKITKIPISYADFIEKFGPVRDAYNAKHVLELKGLSCGKKGDTLFVYKSSEYVDTIVDKLMPIGECMKVDGIYVPLNALDTWTFVCEECGERHMKTERKEVHMADGSIKHMCCACSLIKAFQCSCCGEWYEHSLHCDEDACICKTCRETRYTTCPECGRLFRKETCIQIDDMYICNNCKCRLEGKVRYYHDNPELNFLGEGDTFIGTEIETVGDSAKNYYRRIKFTDDFGDHEDALYQMKDGSLSSYGIENITMPMSKEYFDDFNFEDWFEGLKERGAIADRTCGLHVHLSREWMGTDVREEQDLLVGRMRQFLSDNKDYVQKFARRTDEQWCKYKKSFDKSDKPTSKEERINKHKSNAKGGDRYTSVNNTNENTIEFRIFAGTLDALTYRAAVEFCIRVVDYIMTHEENTETWAEFVNYKPLPETMKTYMESRRMETSFNVEQ